LFRQPFVFVHQFSSLIFFSHCRDERDERARPSVTFFRCVPSLE
jgi:hypothetical protein